MAAYNLHRLFSEAPGKKDFLTELGVLEDEEQALRDARDLIRVTIQTGCANWQQIFDRRIVLAETALRKLLPDPKLRPKFRMQGSACQSFRTLNDPAHRPPQSIDYDDGIYLPVSFLAETKNPILASAGFFRLIETILKPSAISKDGSSARRSRPASASS